MLITSQKLVWDLNPNLFELLELVLPPLRILFWEAGHRCFFLLFSVGVTGDPSGERYLICAENGAYSLLKGDTWKDSQLWSMKMEF